MVLVSKKQQSVLLRRLTAPECENPDGHIPAPSNRRLYLQLRRCRRVQHSGLLLRLLARPSCTGRPRQDDVHRTLWNLSVHAYAVLPQERARNLSASVGHDPLRGTMADLPVVSRRRHCFFQRPGVTPGPDRYRVDTTAERGSLPEAQELSLLSAEGGLPGA